MLFAKVLEMLRNGKRRKYAILGEKGSREMERNRGSVSMDLEVWKQIQSYNHYYRV